MKITQILRTTFALLVTPVAVHAQVPVMLNHQGLVTAGGTNFTGTGQFQFALVSGTTTYWSNGAPIVSLPVNQGLYSVQLGDTGVVNMAALPATVFTNSDVRLRIAFAVSGNPQPLTPDQRIVAVGYALMAQNVADGAITSSKLASSITNVTVIAGAGLSGGGLTSLGGTNTLTLDLTHTNYWTAPQTITGNLIVTGNVVAAGSLSATGDVLAARLNVGSGNSLSGNFAAIGGGYSNVASGVASFAAGSHAHATNNGAFVWGDNSGVPIGSTGSNSVTFQCNGGVTFTSGTVVGLSTQTVAWVPGNLGWTYTSDKYSKQGFAPVDARSVLEKIGRLPITEWNYIGYSQRHIGPMAQDWHALFPLNPSDVTINSADMTGVSLVAIQGLYQELQETKTQNAALEKRLAELEKLIGQLARPEGK